VGVARESLPFAAGSLAAAALAAFWSPWASLPPLAFLAFTLFFFRDPERRPPQDPRAVVSPADGRILEAGERRISIFLNVFNVHVCRSPMGGRIVSVTHVPGRFLAAFKDEASEQNERTAIVVDGGGVRLTFVLVAGLIARRIVCKVAAGQSVPTGGRVGLIRFGSRVDVELPPGCAIEVARGVRVVAGETVIARLTSPPG
jgi:phosphatidylserine decarboxylase